MLNISSPVFAQGGPIPRAHTCDGADLSPPLTWKGIPESTASLALVVEDPDAPAGNWVHWIIYNIPATAKGLPSGMSDAPEIEKPVSARQGTNSFGKSGYGGPCPPPGAPHRYVFSLVALDRELDLPPGATQQVFDKSIEGHVLERAKTMGTYGRKK